MVARLRDEVVVVTGASGGAGRAAARRFGAAGAQVALLARGETGLDAAAEEVRRAGGRALVVPADVAEHREVEAAADQVEHELGPIDVWVNTAFSTVFAPFTDVDPEEYERATRVTYLGFVNGTRAALARMRPRGRGTIVNAGSALATRGIPLQSVYCAAKHAIKGFHESLRCELLHEGSAVRLTLVHLPALNTPQFDWARSKLSRHPQPVPPIYQPEVAARALVHAAAHPRREYWVGAATVGTILANRIAPGLLDRYLARTAFDSQQTGPDDRGPQAGNLWKPADDRHGHDFGVRGGFDDRSHPRSAQAALSRRRGLVLVAVTLATGGLAALRLRGRPHR